MDRRSPVCHFRSLQVCFSCLLGIDLPIVSPIPGTDIDRASDPDLDPSEPCVSLPVLCLSLAVQDLEQQPQTGTLAPSPLSRPHSAYPRGPRAVIRTRNLQGRSLEAATSEADLAPYPSPLYPQSCTTTSIRPWWPCWCHPEGSWREAASPRPQPGVQGRDTKNPIPNTLQHWSRLVFESVKASSYLPASAGRRDTSRIKQPTTQLQ